MAVQTIFKRYELKYKLDKRQYSLLTQCMQGKMELDEYARHKISNIYFDTDDYRVIRFSLEKPNYKEKLRLRIYGTPSEENPAFIELKKKYDGVVYKRRILDSQKNALSYLSNGYTNENSQMHKEINYFINTYDDLLQPKIYLSYEREAFFSKDDENFRMTFDFNIKMRDKNVSLYDDEKEDVKILDDDYVLLEVKTAQGLPFWLIKFLNENEIYKTSFSKYGTAYNRFLLPKLIDNTKEIYKNA